jgi:2,3-bisphosphoglycerate-independent phosphoglycerate mutase
VNSLVDFPPIKMTKSSKVCFVMVDGIADTSISELGRKTPLQFANTPTMDYIAKIGLNG